MSKHALSSHHFPATTEKQLDEYLQPADEAKLEDKPREVTDITLWLQCCYRIHHTLTQFYGTEWLTMWSVGW